MHALKWEDLEGEEEEEELSGDVVNMKRGESVFTDFTWR